MNLCIDLSTNDNLLNIDTPPMGSNLFSLAMNKGIVMVLVLYQLWNIICFFALHFFSFCYHRFSMDACDADDGRDISLANCNAYILMSKSSMI